jgi:hypothetical protein
MKKQMLKMEQSDNISLNNRNSFNLVQAFSINSKKSIPQIERMLRDSCNENFTVIEEDFSNKMT